VNESSVISGGSKEKPAGFLGPGTLPPGTAEANYPSTMN